MRMGARGGNHGGAGAERGIPVRSGIEATGAAGPGATVAPTVEAIVAHLRARRDPAAIAGMARYGIKVDDACGLSLPALRGLGRQIVAQLGRRNPSRHALALELWETGIHDARLLAGMVDLSGMVTVEQMEAWVLDLDSWDVCDQLCNNLLVDTPHAWDKALEWSGREEEFVKRAGFALMASLAVGDKTAPGERFLPLLAAIEREAGDERNYVKKAVNWALRQIGKRNLALHGQATATAQRIAATGGRAGRWVAADALRELRSDAVRRRLGAWRAGTPVCRGARERSSRARVSDARGERE